MSNFRFRFGLPPRTAGTRCVLGRARSDEGTITPEDSTPKEDYVDVTGFSPRDPKHKVSGEYDEDLDETTVSYVRAYASYPNFLNPGDPTKSALVLKLRGPIESDEDGKPVFPAVTITARPLATQIDYIFTDDVRAPDGPLEGSLNTLWGFVGDPNKTFNENQTDAQTTYVEYGGTVYINETNYFRPDDVPEGHTPPYENPTDAEYDFDTSPRPPGEDAYDWQKWETWDLRYRLPFWYADQMGELSENYDAGTDITTFHFTGYTPSWPSDQNPFYGNWLVPVMPGFYIEGGPSSISSVQMVDVSTKTPEEIAEETQDAVELLTSQPEIIFTRDIRKLYPFSFGVEASNDNPHYSGGSTFNVYETNPDIGSVDQNQYFGQIYEVPFFNINNEFNAWATWALEIKAENCCWIKGYKIRGKVRFKKFEIDLEDEGAIGFALPWSILDPVNAPGGIPGATSFVPSTLGGVTATLWRGMRFRVLKDAEGNDIPPVDAGELDWEVTVDETSATGEPYRFDTFIVAETVMVDGEPEVTLPMESIVFVSDFEVTEIVPPSE